MPEQKTDTQKNAEIAEVLGHWVRYVAHDWPDGETPVCILGPVGLDGYDRADDAMPLTEDFDHPWICTPPVYTTGTAALGLVEEMEKLGWALMVESLTFRRYFAAFTVVSGTYRRETAYADTIPQAIRDAAHKALCGGK